MGVRGWQVVGGFRRPRLPFGSAEGEVGARRNREVGEGVAASHMVDPGGPMGPRSVLFFRKYFSSLARMCFP